MCATLSPGLARENRLEGIDRARTLLVAGADRKVVYVVALKWRERDG